MYERSAIVLERYFENLLDYRKECNIRDNFSNYCDLVEKLEKYQVNYQKELVATQEFNKSVEKVKAVQASQEKLYKKSAKLEYNRNLLFNNIDGKVEDTRKCIEKVEADVDKINESMKETKEKLIDALTEYNDKRFELSKCKRYKKIAENAYNESLETAKVNFEGITQEAIDSVKAFSKFDDTEDIKECLEKNGKDEKIPFNEGVIENATLFGLDIAKKEAVGYLFLYDKMSKLLSDIESGTTKIELHKKYLRNEKAKMDFLFAVKGYIVQFLDYERMTIIHGRKSHNRLMSEACENFSADVVQINNMFELLVREATNKSTKKAYKELYNKSYLIDIQEKEEKFKKEKNRVNLNTATLINSNYWRIEGIKEIYTVFYKNVSEVFGKDVAEFDLPKEDVEEDSFDEPINQEEDIEDNNIETVKEEEKIPFEIDNDYSNSDDIIDNNNEEDYYNTYNDIIDNVIESFQEDSEEEEFDIFGEKYKNIDLIEKNLKPVVDDVEEQFEEDIPYEIEEEEENLFVEVKPIKKPRKNEIEDFDLTEEENKPNKILKKIRKISNVKNKKAQNDIW